MAVKVTWATVKLLSQNKKAAGALIDTEQSCLYTNYIALRWLFQHLLITLPQTERFTKGYRAFDTEAWTAHTELHED